MEHPVQSLKLERVDQGFVTVRASGEIPGATPQIIMSDDGAPLNVYQWGQGHRDCIVICQPIGVLSVLMRLFIEYLAKRFWVITWDTRGYPSVNENFHETDCSLSRHTADLFNIADQLGVERFHVVGYCTGARIALRAARARPVVVGKLALISGRFVFSEDNSSSSPRGSYFSGPAEDIALAAKAGDDLCELYRRGFHDPVLQGVEDLDFFKDASMYVFSSADTMQRYSQMVISALQGEKDDWIETLETETLILGAEDDKSVRMPIIRGAHFKMPNSQIITYGVGGHYAVYKPEYIDAIGNDIASFLT